MRGQLKSEVRRPSSEWGGKNDLGGIAYYRESKRIEKGRGIPQCSLRIEARTPHRVVITFVIQK